MTPPSAANVGPPFDRDGSSLPSLRSRVDVDRAVRIGTEAPLIPRNLLIFRADKQFAKLHTYEGAGNPASRAGIAAMQAINVAVLNRLFLQHFSERQQVVLCCRFLRYGCGTDAPRRTGSSEACYISWAF
jgi:hypothetical protein